MDDPDAVEQSGINSEKVILYQNAPNPFNENTTINCYIPETIQKSDFSTGTYFLTISSINQTKTEKIIINK
jgi:hypothetical protein